MRWTQGILFFDSSSNNYLLTGKKVALFYRDELEVCYWSSAARPITCESSSRWKSARFTGWYVIFFPMQKIYKNKQTKQSRCSPSYTQIPDSLLHNIALPIMLAITDTIEPIIINQANNRKRWKYALNCGLAVCCCSYHREIKLLFLPLLIENLWVTVEKALLYFTLSYSWAGENFLYWEENTFFSAWNQLLISFISSLKSLRVVTSS